MDTFARRYPHCAQAFEEMQTLAQSELVPEQRSNLQQVPGSQRVLGAEGPQRFADELRAVAERGVPEDRQAGAGVYSTPVRDAPDAAMECEAETPVLGASQQMRRRSRERRPQRSVSGERARTRSRTVDVVDGPQG
eukprot:6439096-Amphidinium_carterae.1